MAIQGTDLFVVYRPSTKINYKLALKDLDTVPDGTEVGQLLTWNGTEWEPTTPVPPEGIPDGTAEGQVLIWDGTEWIPGIQEDHLLKPGSEGSFLINEDADGNITYEEYTPLEAIDGGEYV